MNIKDKKLIELNKSHSPKKTFSTVFLVLVVLLMAMPFITTINDIMARFAIQFQWYKAIENAIIPIEVRFVAAVLRIFNIEIIASTNAISVMKNGSWQRILVSWNCVGWQSLIILLITFLTGLQGQYKIITKLQTAAIGILGIFLINVLRIDLVVILFKLFGYFPAVIFHDYFANIMVVSWVFFFWWFSYTFVLEEKDPGNSNLSL